MNDFDTNKIISSKIEHTILRPDASLEDIEKICEEGIKYNFYGVCVHPYWVRFVKNTIKGTKIKVISVCGFPDGMNKTETKITEIKELLRDGVDEIDMVMNIGSFKSKEYEYVKNEIRKVKEVMNDKTLKIIIETPLLNEEEIRIASNVVEEGNGDFIKTGTGRNGSVKLSDINIIKNSARLPIKAAGGIKTREFAYELIQNGVSRIGTSSGPTLIK